MNKCYKDWCPSYQYKNQFCLFGTERSRQNTSFVGQDALLLNWNSDNNFNGILAVSNKKWLTYSNYYAHAPHGKVYDTKYHIHRYCAFVFHYLTTVCSTPVRHIEEGALFANAFSDSNLGHDLSCTMSFIHEYKKRQLQCPIILLERCKTRPRIIEFLTFFFDPSLFVFLPDQQVWKIQTLHMFSSLKNKAFFNIYQFPSLIQQAIQRALVTAGSKSQTNRPNVFLAKTHEQKLVLIKRSVLTCPELLAQLRTQPDWVVVNPEDAQWTLPRLIVLLQRANKIVTSTGSICYAHEPFFNPNATCFFINGVRGPYETHASRYKVINVNKKLNRGDTARVFRLLTS